MVKATLGFIFTPDFSQVLLITKNRPDWQVGKINGLGGKCEEGETFKACISREVQEEANILISPRKWKEVASLNWQKWQVKVFTTVWPNSLDQISTTTDEKVEWFEVERLPTNVMSNLRWLIPLSVDSLTNLNLEVVRIKYTN